MTERKGNFIVLEGVDGAGTTTQGQRLVSALNAVRRPAHFTQEPSGGPVGSMIRQVLTDRLVVPGNRGACQPWWSQMALLFAADRLDHLQSEIEPLLDQGVTVVSDRYVHSSMAYQTVTGVVYEDTPKWIREINRFARRPDLTLVLDVRADTARDRRQTRAKSEIYERDELQSRLCYFYRDIDRYFPGERIEHVDGELPVDVVSEAVLKSVMALY